MLPGKDEDPGEDGFDCRTGRLLSAGRPAREKLGESAPGASGHRCAMFEADRLKIQLGQFALAVSAFLDILKADRIAETTGIRAHVASNQQPFALPQERHLPAQ